MLKLIAKQNHKQKIFDILKNFSHDNYFAMPVEYYFETKKKCAFLRW